MQWYIAVGAPLCKQTNGIVSGILTVWPLIQAGGDRGLVTMGHWYTVVTVNTYLYRNWMNRSYIPSASFLTFQVQCEAATQRTFLFCFECNYLLRPVRSCLPRRSFCVACTVRPQRVHCTTPFLWDECCLPVVFVVYQSFDLAYSFFLVYFFFLLFSFLFLFLKLRSVCVPLFSVKLCIFEFLNNAIVKGKFTSFGFTFHHSSEFVLFVGLLFSFP